jgi:hypothetical protein
MILRPQTRRLNEAALWILCLTMAFLLGVPLIAQGVREIEIRTSIAMEVERQISKIDVDTQKPAVVEAPQQIFGQAHLDLNALAQANSIGEADNARWSLIRRTPVAAQVYDPDNGVNWSALRNVCQTGTILVPAGFSWSFNQTFQEGPGYKEASGILEGGHCALATAFRGAAIDAGLPTQARPHRWPIPGFALEKTVNVYWGRDDLVVHNTSGHDLYFLWEVSPDGIEVTLRPVSESNPLPSLPDWRNATVAMVYGGPGSGGWGSLGLTDTADQAITLARHYAQRVDEWNGSRQVAVAINPNAMMVGEQAESDLYLYYLIAEARRQGYYVMLDVQTGEQDPLTLFTNLMDKFLQENVWFDWDIEHTADGKVDAEQINRLADAYFARRNERGYQTPGVFGFYVFQNDQITRPNRLRCHYDNGVVVPIFDGFGGEGQKSGQGKISKTARVLSHFPDGPYGIMEFETRWGQKYDQIGAKEYFDAFPDTLIMVSQ